MSIGASLDIYENIKHFLSRFLSITESGSASVWLQIPLNSNSNASGQYRVFKASQDNESLLDCPQALVLHNVVLKKTHLLLKSDDLLLKGILSEKNNTSSKYCVVYRLDEQGILVLELSGKDSISIVEEKISSIQRVIDKFSLSIKACLAYEKSIKETERREAIQKELEENEEKYRTVVENIAEGLVITDLEDNLIFVNEQMCKLTGYKQDDMLGKKACHVFVPKESWKDYESKTLRRKRGEAEQYEILLKYKEEENWIASINASPYRNRMGEVIGTIAAIIDVTDRRNMELAVMRSEEKYRSIIENMELGLLEVDDNGEIIKAYPKFCELTGYEESELVGKTGIDILLDEENAIKMKNQIAERKEGQSNVYELQLKKKNGEKVSVMISAAPYYDENNRVVGSVGIHLDITKRKKAEQAIRESSEKLQLILGTSLDAIITIDETSVVTDWNPSAEKIFGFKQSEAVGALLSDLIVPVEMRERHNKGMARFMNTGEGPVLNKRVELPVLRKSGEQFPIELTISPIKIQGKYFFSAFCRDITKRKQSEQALIDAKKAAEQARNVERQFLAHMSHEIRTPMNAVIGMTYLLRRSELSTEQKDYVESLKFSADSLMGIISDILDLSKIEAGEIELEYRPFSLHHILESLQRSYQFRVQEKNISVEITIDNKIQNQIIGDKTRIGQILGNLLSNASKFTSEGYIGVNALLEKVVDGKYWIKLQIYDTGIGISKENIAVIFNSFKQATIDTHREFGGTGLGLSIVKQLVELQGGTINVESELGKGTMFEVLLPFKDSGMSIEEIKDNKIQSRKTLRQLDSLKILIAEDNPINQKLITSIFSQWGVKFDLASNGLEALNYSMENKYDLIFMDINMPKMNGYEAVLAIKNEASNPNVQTPIITLTAAALHEERKRMFEAGVYDFITKPFSPQLLHQTIIKCLDKSLELEPFDEEEIELQNLRVKKHYDLSHLEKFSQGNPKFVIEMIEMFLEQNPENLKNLESSIVDAHWAKVQDLAHQMKSTFGTLGMEKEQEIAKTIEHNVRNDKLDVKHNLSLAKKIITGCETIYPDLEQEIKT